MMTDKPHSQRTRSGSSFISFFCPFMNLVGNLYEMLHLLSTLWQSLVWIRG